MSFTAEYFARKYPGQLTAGLVDIWRAQEEAEKVLLEAKKAFEMWIAKECLSEAYKAIGTAKAEYMKAHEERNKEKLPSKEVKERLAEAIENLKAAKKLALPAAQRYWDLLNPLSNSPGIPTPD